LSLERLLSFESCFPRDELLGLIPFFEGFFSGEDFCSGDDFRSGEDFIPSFECLRSGERVLHFSLSFERFSSGEDLIPWFVLLRSAE